ncbi:hypothetical protein ACIUY2_24965 [Pseudomonas aeruginosa]
MGEVKIQLAEEALADEAAAQVSTTPPAEAIAAVPAATPAAPTEVIPAPEQPAAPEQAALQHEMSITLSPNQGAEVKLEMKQGAKVN